jgi:hypothetical protein
LKQGATEVQLKWASQHGSVTQVQSGTSINKREYRINHARMHDALYTIKLHRGIAARVVHQCNALTRQPKARAAMSVSFLSLQLQSCIFQASLRRRLHGFLTGHLHLTKQRIHAEPAPFA